MSDEQCVGKSGIEESCIGDSGVEESGVHESYFDNSGGDTVMMLSSLLVTKTVTEKGAGPRAVWWWVWYRKSLKANSMVSDNSVAWNMVSKRTVVSTRQEC